MTLKTILRLTAVATIYVVLTLVSYPISFGLVQFRISEVLVLLCFYRKDYGYAMILGCFIANFFNPSFPVVDAIVGTTATALSVLLIMYSRNIIIASLFPVVINGVMVGTMLHFMLEEPLVFAMLSVAFGELVVISIFGIIIFRILEKNSFFMQLIEANQNL